MISEDLKRTSGMVKLRGGFSDRYNIIDFNKIQQIDEFDDDTRIRLANNLLSVLNGCFYDGFQEAFDYTKSQDEIIDKFCKNVLTDLFCERINSYGYNFNFQDIFTNKIELVILHATYNEVLDVLQYCCQWLANETLSDEFYDFFNGFFENEYIGYRFLDERIVPITDETELKEISEACNNPYEGTRSHIKNAVQFLANRQSKQYKKCIEESILAIESVCKIITGNDNAVLSDALKIIEKKEGMHPSLKQGFLKLYAYTSDKGGIRHAEGLFESNVSFNEAKYFLVSCSAFVNYLIAEYAKGSN